MVTDPAEYRWSSYGEAIGGSLKGNGKKARMGLMRACRAQNSKVQSSNFKEEEEVYSAEKWKETSRIYRRVMGLALGRKKGNAKLGEVTAGANLNDEEMISTKDNGTVLPDLGMAKMLRTRVRYFTDGAVIGSKTFVNEAFAAARERFSENRKDGARKMRGAGKGAGGTLWSVRDLRVGV
jgi:hypothetical protein